MSASMEQYRLAPRIKELVRDNAQVWQRDGHEQAPDKPAINHLGELEAPTLLLVGSRDARDNHNIALILEASVPLLVRRNVHDAGHLLPMERPEWFVAVVTSFLQQAEIR